MTDLSKFSLQELKKLKLNVEREIDRKVIQSKKSLQKKARELAAAEGLELSDVLNMFAAEPEQPQPVKRQKPKKAATVSSPKKAIEPKYFNQIDPSKTWTGRGRKPEWVVIWLDNGGDLEKLTQKPF